MWIKIKGIRINSLFLGGILVYILILAQKWMFPNWKYSLQLFYLGLIFGGLILILIAYVVADHFIHKKRNRIREEVAKYFEEKVNNPKGDNFFLQDKIIQYVLSSPDIPQKIKIHLFSKIHFNYDVKPIEVHLFTKDKFLDKKEYLINMTIPHLREKVEFKIIFLKTDDGYEEIEVGGEKLNQRYYSKIYDFRKKEV